VDFNVDFDNWPPPQEAVDLLKSRYANVKVIIFSFCSVYDHSCFQIGAAQARRSAAPKSEILNIQDICWELQ
jgi:hypothetical protein